MQRAILLFALGASPMYSSAFADDRPVGQSSTISIRGFVDAYYGWNDNAPRSHESFVPGTGTTAGRANEFNLNLAAIDITRDAGPAGFHLSVVAGNGTDVVHSAEPIYRYLYQASVLYRVGDRLILEGGIYPSHIGFESFYSKDNWNYTRGWLGEFSPYYQTGLKATYTLSSRWSGQVHVLNGWQIIGENNDAKAIGTQIAFSVNRFSASLNTFFGPELANDNKHLRSFGDAVATWKATPKVTLGASLDRGRQALPQRTAANWFGIGGYVRYVRDQRHALAARLERFHDPDNGISGTAQTLGEATITYEVHPAPNLIVKIEGRRDHSTAPVFNKQTNELSRHQTLVVIGAVATF